MYEYSDKSAEKLDAIYRELHIVHTVRFKLGWDTALKVEGIMACPNRPLYVVYKYCEYGSLKQYLIQHRERLAYAERLFVSGSLNIALFRILCSDPLRPCLHAVPDDRAGRPPLQPARKEHLRRPQGTREATAHGVRQALDWS